MARINDEWSSNLERVAKILQHTFRPHSRDNQRHVSRWKSLRCLRFGFSRGSVWEKGRLGCWTVLSSRWNCNSRCCTESGDVSITYFWTLFCTMADNLRFIVSRLIIGFGTSFLIQTSPILISELAYPTHRGRISGMHYCTYVCLTYYPANILCEKSLADISKVSRRHRCCLDDLRNVQNP
jgi:hypothetical protein